MKSAFLRLHLAVFLAGFTGILGRLITLNEGLLVWYRLLFSAITLWIFFGLQKKVQKISFRQIAAITGAGFVAAVHWVTFYGAIKYANVSVALVCFSAIGFFTAIIEPLFLRRKPILTEVLLGLLMMLGIYIIFHFDPRFKTGIIIGLFSAMLGAIFPVLNRQLLKKVNVETLTTYELSGGFLTLSVLLPFYLRQFPTEHIFPNLTDLGWLLFLAWVCTVWAFQLSSYALKHISAFTVNLTYNLEPVYGIILAFIVYNENKYLGWNFYAGLLVIILGVSLHMWRVFRTRTRQ
ncbi:DMT family transporter [Flavihumibacter profundi]|jgi:drug/metabolite transporter (DMT)-like permease|uniref:DMT family transporter n=1 Tax=Flavihumibacter profundi TaxID=2716883 RepID=UPI001CC6928C|nr:DMT family transporter [Flavihumibacter profundi]MBZ5855717.1 DMT family transporter [Flavihumibacter profundi]